MLFQPFQVTLVALVCGAVGGGRYIGSRMLRRVWERAQWEAQEGGRIAARRAEECREDQALAQRGARSCDDELKLL